MKAIYFERSERSLHMYGSSRAKGVYIPDESVVLYKEQRGVFGETTYSFTDRQEILDEMQSLLKGASPNVEGVTYSEIKEFEYDGTRLKEIIQNARLKRELRDKVKFGIDALLEETK